MKYCFKKMIDKFLVKRWKFYKIFQSEDCILLASFLTLISVTEKHFLISKLVVTSLICEMTRCAYIL